MQKASIPASIITNPAQIEICATSKATTNSVYSKVSQDAARALKVVREVRRAFPSHAANGGRAYAASHGASDRGAGVEHLILRGLVHHRQSRR